MLPTQAHTATPTGETKEPAPNTSTEGGTFARPPVIIYDNVFECPNYPKPGKDLLSKFVDIYQKAKERNKYNHFKQPAPPSCSKSHSMVISSFNGIGNTAGYRCDLCQGQSSQGHCGGEMKR